MFSCIVTWLGPVALYDTTLSGSSPAEYAYQFAFSAFAMFRKKITDWALTVSPSDHFQPFRFTTTVRPPSE